MGRLFFAMAAISVALACMAIPSHAAPEPDECLPARQVQASIESWKKELSKKGQSQTRITELMDKLKLKTGIARELPDVERSGAGKRSIEILGVEDYKVKLTGSARPETVVQVRYQLKLGAACGEHEDRCFEGYAVQVLRPLASSQWCALGTDLSVEVWGPEREYTFCTEARTQARELSFFALTAAGRKAVMLDDFRAHCPSNGNRSRSHERSYWEARGGALVEIFRITLTSQAGGPDLGKLTTIKGRLAFSGDFPKLVHYEVAEENCGAGVFSPDAASAKSACQKNERFQVFQYKDGRYAPEAPPKDEKR